MRAQHLMIVGVTCRARRKPRVRTGRPRRLAVADGAGGCAAHVVGAHRRQDLGGRRCRSRASNCSGPRSSRTSRAASTVSDQGVTASGVTLFVPMSLVTGSSNNVYAIDNDLGYVVWERQFDVALPAPTAGCPGGISAGATRIVRLDGTVSSVPGFGGGRGAVGYRSAAWRARARRAGRSARQRRGTRWRRRRPTPPRPRRLLAAVHQPRHPARPRGAAASRTIGSLDRRARRQARHRRGGLGRPSGVGYVITSDGMLHVLGLPSGKDIQRPASFLPANARWSSPIGMDTMLYAATSAGCGGAPHAVWAIDLDSETKPVVSWKTNGGPVVGAVAFAPDGTLFAAVGAGQTDGRRQSERDRRARSEDAAAEGLVHAARGRVRDRADHPSARGQGHRRRGHQGRPHPAARREVARRRGPRDASLRIEDVAGTGGDGQC